MVELADVEAAREAIAGRLHRTPVFGSATLGELAGARVFLKAELFQKTGSFKPRGVLTNLAALGEEQRARAFHRAVGQLRGGGYVLLPIDPQEAARVAAPACPSIGPS